MDVFGSFALTLAFICAVYAFGGGIAAIITRHPLLVKSTQTSGYRDLLSDFYRHIQPRISLLHRQFFRSVRRRTQQSRAFDISTR